jgi:S-adenosylmethionine:tRNA ribosyltransferase-isomerase
VSKYKNIEISEFDYNLPDEKIAKYPLKIRHNSKLLIYKNETISESIFNEIGSALPKDSLLIYNNTKVIQARLHFKKQTGAKIEIFCLEPIIPSDYSIMFQSTNECFWECIVGNQKKWKEGILRINIQIDEKNVELCAEKLNSGANPTIKFSWNNNVEFGQILDKIGNIPIPPYLNRESEENDKKTYQTIYSKHDGSVAAPTAGLHFTEKVMGNLKNIGISFDKVTLHVGAGTFKPVKSKIIGEHEMHFEHFIISKSLIENIIKNFGNIVAVGTTSVRTLESLYYIAIKIYNKEYADEFTINQWEAYEGNKELDIIEALNIILNYLNVQNKNILHAKTQIMIVPGYKFKIINAIITNFHQPKSTLLLLISAITGEKWKDIYKYALNNNFRFLSYGDSSLIFV